MYHGYEHTSWNMYNQGSVLFAICTSVKILYHYLLEPA